MTGKAAEEHHADVYISHASARQRWHRHRHVFLFWGLEDNTPVWRDLTYGSRTGEISAFGLVFECLDWFSVVNTADFVES